MPIIEWKSKAEIREAMKLALKMNDTHRFDVLSEVLVNFREVK